MTPLDWMTDPHLCGRTFGGPSFAAARALVAAIYGLPLDAEALAIYRACSGRSAAPTVPASRAMVIAGRGSGKTLLAAFLIVYLACSRDFRPVLGPGELATAMLLCPDRRQARVAFRYVRGLLRASPMLDRLVTAETSESLTLSTGCVIEIHTASFRSTRGYSLAGAVIDECAFLPTDDAANPDAELVRAVTPGLARVPGSLLLCISSPYARRGVLWDWYRAHHGVDGSPVLTWQAPTRRMNPTIAQTVIDEAHADDPAAARAEWDAEFRADIEGLIGWTELEGCVEQDRVRRPPMGHAYAAAIDAASGTQAGDSFTACVYHRETRHGAPLIVVDDLLETRPPFQVAAAVERLRDFLRPYGVGVVWSDRYASEFLVDALRRVGLGVMPTLHTRSEAYVLALPWLVGGRVSLPDPARSVTADRMMRQFSLLQRRTTSRTGRDSVDHPRGGHDDVANVVALAIAHGGRATGSISRVLWG